MKIAKIFATGISGDIRSEFTVYNVKDLTLPTAKAGGILGSLTAACTIYELLDRQEVFTQSKIKALVAQLKKVKKW